MLQKHKFLLWAFLLLQNLCIPEIIAYRPQEIILFSEDNYTGAQKSFYSSVEDLQSLPEGQKAKSHCVVRGLWRINGTFSNDSDVEFVENVFSDEKNGRVCGSWNSPSKKAVYRSIKLIGSPDLDASAITFFSKSKFFGNQELYFEGTKLRLPKAQNFTSYGFSGSHNWTIFNGTDLTGPSECLVANVDLNGGYSMTFDFNKNMTIGSIWRGCGSHSPPPSPLLKKIPDTDSKKSCAGVIKSTLVVVALLLGVLSHFPSLYFS